MIEVEKGIPIPKKKSRGRPKVYPTYTMEVGESFVIPIEAHSSTRQAAGRCKPKRFTIRKIDDGHYRCWRVE